MAIVSIKNKTKSGSLLVGNDKYIPPSFESIATASGTGSSGTITFSSLGSDYKHLQLRILGIATTNSGAAGLIRFNGDTGANYAYHILDGYASTVTSGGVANNTEILYIYNNEGMHNVYANVTIIDILDAFSTTKNKTIRAINGMDRNTGGEITVLSGLWRSTAALSSITLSLNDGSYATTTRAALYGIKEA